MKKKTGSEFEREESSQCACLCESILGQKGSGDRDRRLAEEVATRSRSRWLRWWNCRRSRLPESIWQIADGTVGQKRAPWSDFKNDFNFKLLISTDWGRFMGNFENLIPMFEIS